MLSETDKGQLVVALCKFATEARKEGTITHGIKCLGDAVKEIERVVSASGETAHDKHTSLMARSNTKEQTMTARDREQMVEEMANVVPVGSIDMGRVLRKLGSLQGQMLELRANINALQVETERLEDSIRNDLAEAKESGND